MRLLHAADLHLGSPLAAFSPDRAAARRNRQLDALERLFADGVAAGAQMILLAGDVFDTPTPDRNTAARFFGICRAQSVPVIVAPGNHDPWVAGGAWAGEALPQNLYVFHTDRLSRFDFPHLGAAIYGYAFTAEGMPSPDVGSGEALLPDRTCVLLCHADLLSPLSPYAPLSGEQLARSGFQYAALGHVHNAPAPVRYGGTVAAYSGFFAGRGFDEVGAGRALLVELEGSHVSLHPIDSTADRFETVELDCEGAVDNEEIYTRLRGYLQNSGFSPETALRVMLAGRVGLACRVDTARLASLGGELALLELRDGTLPIPDGDFLQKDPTLRGAFYRALLPRLNSADGEERALAAEALRLGLAALSGGEV